MNHSPATGLLLFAHGARDPLWARPFQAVLAEVQRQHAGVPVRLAFLEFMTPGLVDAALALADEGAQRIQVVPLFLGAGGHVRKDLPDLLAQAQAARPGLSFELQAAIGESPAVVQAMASAAVAGLRR